MQKTIARKRHLQNNARATVNAAIMKLLHKNPGLLRKTIKNTATKAVGASLVLGLFGGVIIGYFIKR